eukprot:14711808-Alexandrium_andersonii.AAC.1
MVGVSIDIYKCFDQLPRPVVRQLFQRMGAPSHMVTPWWSFVQSLRIVNVLADSVGIEYQRACSIPQGCPLSMALLGA